MKCPKLIVLQQSEASLKESRKIIIWISHSDDFGKENVSENKTTDGINLVCLRNTKFTEGNFPDEQAYSSLATIIAAL